MRKIDSKIGPADSIVARQRHAEAFFNGIGQERPNGDVRAESVIPPKTDIRLMGWHVR